MSWLQASARMVHASKLPAGVTRDEAIRLLLQDHDFFLQCDPHLVQFRPISPETPPAVPDAVSAVAVRPTQSYEVTDTVHTLPAGLWDSRVVSTYEMTDMPAGLFVRIKSPLSVVMDTVWEIRPVEDQDDAELELVEEASISCSRFLVGTVKGLAEGGWAQIHAKMLARLDAQPPDAPNTEK